MQQTSDLANRERRIHLSKKYQICPYCPPGKGDNRKRKPPRCDKYKGKRVGR